MLPFSYDRKSKEYETALSVIQPFEFHLNSTKPEEHMEDMARTKEQGQEVGLKLLGTGRFENSHDNSCSMAQVRGRERKEPLS